MIQSFANATTEDLFHGKNTKAARAIDQTVWKVAARKLDLLNAATTLGDLAVPPGNQLEALKGDQKGRHSIRVNHQYRLTFQFKNGHVYEVRCEDYH